MLFVVDCCSSCLFLFVVYCLLLVPCVWFVVCCSSFNVGFYLSVFVVGCSLSVVCCLLRGVCFSVEYCLLLRFVCWFLFVVVG